MDNSTKYLKWGLVGIAVAAIAYVVIPILMTMVISTVVIVFCGLLLLAIWFALPAICEWLAQGSMWLWETAIRTNPLVRMRRDLQSDAKDITEMDESIAKQQAGIDSTRESINKGRKVMDPVDIQRWEEDLGQVKTLLAMHPEQLHWIALAKTTVKQAGTGMLGKVGMGGTETPLTEVGQLAGMKVGAWGGSLETAKQVRLDSEISFNIVEQTNFKSAKEQLEKGNIDVILMVGGAPMSDISGDPRATPPVPGLSRDFRLLAMSPVLAKKISNAYQPARVSYTNLGAAGIPTVSVNALFVTRNYTTAKMQSSLGALRGCVQSKLADIKETTGTHPSWQNVSAENKGTWGWYTIPSSVAPAQIVPAVAPAQPKKK